MPGPELKKPLFDAPPLSSSAQSSLQQSELGVSISRARLLSEITPVVESRPFTVRPDADYPVSNVLRSNQIGYVYGVNMQYPQYSAQALSNLRGKAVYVIPNTTEGLGKDLSNCVQGTLSTHLGVVTERSAVYNTLEFVKDQIVSQNLPVELCFYSQGNLIGNMAMKLLEQEIKGPNYSQLSRKDKAVIDEQLAFLAKNIHIYRYGSPTDFIEAGGCSVSFKHDLDIVARLSPFITTKEAFVNRLSGDSSGRSANIVIRNPGERGYLKDHDILGYLENNAYFYNQSHAGLNAEQKATALVHSIQSGFFSDPEFSKIVLHTLNDPGKTEEFKARYCAVISQAAMQGHLGKFAYTSFSAEVRQQMEIRQRQAAAAAGYYYR